MHRIDPGTKRPGVGVALRVVVIGWYHYHGRRVRMGTRDAQRRALGRSEGKTGPTPLSTDGPSAAPTCDNPTMHHPNQYSLVMFRGDDGMVCVGPRRMGTRQGGGVFTGE